MSIRFSETDGAFFFELPFEQVEVGAVTFSIRAKPLEEIAETMNRVLAQRSSRMVASWTTVRLPSGSSRLRRHRLLREMNRLTPLVSVVAVREHGELYGRAARLTRPLVAEQTELMRAELGFVGVCLEDTADALETLAGEMEHVDADGLGPRNVIKLLMRHPSWLFLRVVSSDVLDLWQLICSHSLRGDVRRIFEHLGAEEEADPARLR